MRSVASVSRTGAILALFLAVLGAAAAPAEAAIKAALTGYDTIVTTGGRTTLRFKVEADNFIHWNVHGVRVEFLANGAVIGSAVSRDEGYADLLVSAGATAGDVVISGRVAAGQSYTSPSQTLLLAIRSPQARLTIVDIDKTICDGSNTDILFKSASKINPLTGAVRGLQDIGVDATIVYLTARDDSLMLKTKSWLSYWAFPRGPVICTDKLMTMLGNPTQYKSATIRFLKAQFPTIPVGIGNKNTDADAYQQNGLATILFDTENDRPYRTFAFVYAGWDAFRAACRAGQRPEMTWSTRFR